MLALKPSFLLLLSCLSSSQPLFHLSCTSPLSPTLSYPSSSLTLTTPVCFPYTLHLSFPCFLPNPFRGRGPHCVHRGHTGQKSPSPWSWGCILGAITLKLFWNTCLVEEGQCGSEGAWRYHFPAFSRLSREWLGSQARAFR